MPAGSGELQPWGWANLRSLPGEQSCAGYAVLEGKELPISLLSRFFQPASLPSSLSCQSCSSGSLLGLFPPTSLSTPSYLLFLFIPTFCLSLPLFLLGVLPSPFKINILDTQVLCSFCSESRSLASEDLGIRNILRCFSHLSQGRRPNSSCHVRIACKYVLRVINVFLGAIRAVSWMDICWLQIPAQLRDH